MVSQRLLVIKWTAQALQHLLKALGVVIRRSFQKVLSILLKLWRLFSSIRPKRTLDPSNNPPAELREQPPHPDTRNSIVCASSLPTLRAAEQHPLATAPPTTIPEPYHTSGSSEPESMHDFLDETSSITQVSRVPTPLPNSILPLNHNPISIQPVQTSSDEEDKLVAVTPREYERYSREKLDKKETNEYTIPPLKRTFSSLAGSSIPEPGSKSTLRSRAPLPNGWTYHIHPEGFPYFYDENRRILTDFYLYDDEECRRAEKAIRKIMEYMSDRRIAWSNDIELVIEPRESGKVGYYFADHVNQVVFWLGKCDIVWDIKEVKVELWESHVGHLIRSYYWAHNELFPHVRKAPSGVIDEVSGILIHAIGDSLTSSVCLSPYSLDELQSMLNLTREIKKQQHTEHWISSACVLYRLMATFAEQRFLNLHGEKGARLSRDQSIHPEMTQTYFFKFFSLFFLFAPTTYLKKIQENSVDSLVNKPSWSKLKQRLTEEWKDSALFATVLLNANVAFLAIQSVDEANRSNAQRFSYFSVLTSMGAIIFGLLLTRQHQHIFNMGFLANRGVSPLGLETLALMYSLPYVFLMWGTLSFLAAFSFMCYSSNDNRTYVLMSAGWFTLVLLLLWCISTSFETRAYFHPLPIRLWKDLTQKYQEWRTSSQSVGPSNVDVEAAEQPECEDDGP